MKIYTTYKTIASPWGGANNFQRALLDSLHEQYAVECTTKVEEADIIFMNQLSTGPGRSSKLISLGEIAKLKQQSPGAALVIRAINLNSHSYPTGKFKYWLSGAKHKDKRILEALELADFVIFQSHYQREIFRQQGFQGAFNRVIHNGASRVFLSKEQRPELNEEDKLILLSSTMSKRKTKRLDLVLALSQCQDVHVVHAGIWPDELAKGSIEFCGKLNHHELKEKMANAHFFFHPATKDPCPNSLIEGLYFGLPVLFNPDQGSGQELGGEHGIALRANDLEGTVHEARKQYEKLTNKLIAKKNYFGIERATSEYYETFQNVLRFKKMER